MNHKFQGWGFCHRMCDQHNDIWINTLKKVKLTILSQKLCSKFGLIEEKDVLKLAVNPRKELCGAFIDKLVVEFVNYTSQKEEVKFSKFDLEKEVQEQKRRNKIFR